MTVQKIKLGKFKPDPYGMFRGKISALGLGSTEVFSQEVLSQDGKLYLKLIADPSGAAYEIGAAFPKEKDGKIYYSVSLDTPLLPTSLNVALFLSKDNDGTYDLIWNRPDMSKPSLDTTVRVENPPERRYGRNGVNPGLA